MSVIATHQQHVYRDWALHAVGVLEAESSRSTETHLRRLQCDGLPGITIFLKDESAHPTGSLKHRLASSLFMDAVCSGFIQEGMTVVEASSGSTAVSEAYFAQLLGLPFIAVMPESTSPKKIDSIQRFGGRCHLVERPSDVCRQAANLAEAAGGYFMNQFANASRVTDWRRGNVAESLFEQLGTQQEGVPEWVVVGVGTGGTASTMGRYMRYRRLSTRLCVVDTEYSAFYKSYVTGSRAVTVVRPSRIEGVGRGSVEPSFLPGVVDRMFKMPDVLSIAAMHVLSDRLQQQVGASTGTNFMGVCRLAREMRDEGRTGSLATLICDSGARYQDTYYNPAWLAENGLIVRPHIERLNQFLDTAVCVPTLDSTV